MTDGDLASHMASHPQPQTYEMDMLEVLQVIGDGSPGGGTTAVLSLSEELSRRGASVTIASQRSSHIIGQARKRGLRTLELEFGRRRQSRRIAHCFANYLRMCPSTVVHAHGARAGLPIAMLPHDLALSRVYTVHGFHYRHKPPGIRHMARLIERFCIERSNATVFVSNGDARIAQQDRLVSRTTRYHVIHNGSPAAAIAAVAQRSCDIVFLGRLHFQKNPLILPEILAALRPQRPTLRIVGAGEYEAELRQRVAQAGLAAQVTFSGTRPHAQALELLAQARVMLLPSRWEGLPVSIIEAMQRAIPVVASNVPGTDELIADGETGYLVGCEDIIGYADRLKRLLLNEDLRRRMGEAARRRARDHFSPEQVVKAHFALYASLTVRNEELDDAL
jgi:glycosyltransferase involved in cell wall biosynthesis